MRGRKGIAQLLVLWALLLLGMLAMAGREPYSLFAFFLTAVVLLGVSATEPAAEASAQRIMYTVLGAAIALAVYFLTVAMARRAADRATATAPAASG